MKFIIIFCEIFICSTVFGFELERTTFSVDDKTIALWHFDEMEGDISKDATGNNNLSIIGEKPWTVKGLFGGALDLNGIDKYAVLTIPPLIGGIEKSEKGFTIEARVKLRDLPKGHWDSMAIVNNQDEEISDTRSYCLSALRVSPSKVIAYFIISSDGSARDWDGEMGNGAVLGNTNLLPNIWYHIAGVFEPGISIRIYVNGKLDGNTIEVPNRVYSDGSMFKIGTLSITGGLGGGFNGIIDELRISKGARYN